MKRTILLIIDGLGIGAMDDLAEKDRLEDRGTHTLHSVMAAYPGLKIPNLLSLGLENLCKDSPEETGNDNKAATGIARLKYTGADTFLGHQEIMGSRPAEIKAGPFKDVYKRVKDELIRKGYQVEVPDEEEPYLLVEGLVTVADNIEADYGQIYNVTAPLDYIPFEDVVKIGQIVRSCVHVSRVIALGGIGIGVEDILANIENPTDGITGVNCKKLDVYGPGYQVLHLGNRIDPAKQIPGILARAGFEVRLIGKVQDVIQCEGAVEKIPMVSTARIMETLLARMDQAGDGLIAVNVQESDLAGHMEDPLSFGAVLQTVDSYLPLVLEKMGGDDLLLITADHGNDPSIGHTHHTREFTPIIMYREGIEPAFIGVRETLADIAATIADFFAVNFPEDGTSFLI